MFARSRDLSASLLLLAACFGSVGCRPQGAPRPSAQPAFQPAVRGGTQPSEQCAYTFSIDARLSELSATLCCRGSQLTALEPIDDIAAELLRSAARVAPDGTLIESARRDGRGA